MVISSVQCAGSMNVLNLHMSISVDVYGLTRYNPKPASHAVHCKQDALLNIACTLITNSMQWVSIVYHNMH